MLSDIFLITDIDEPFLTASAASIKVRETVELTAEAAAGQPVSICRMEGETIAEQKDGDADEALVWAFSPETAGSYVFRPAARDASTGEVTLMGDPVTVEVTTDGPSPQPETDLPEALYAGEDATLILLPVEGSEALRKWQLFRGDEEENWQEIQSGSAALLSREEIPLAAEELQEGDRFRLVITVLEDGHDATVVEKEWTVESHTWDEGEVVRPATCTEDGEIRYTCTECGKTKTEVIPAKGHTWSEEITVEATCQQPGKVYRICHVCGEEEIIRTLEHNWDTGILIQAPTAEKEGIVRYTCLVGGETWDEFLPKLEKDPVIMKLPASVAVVEEGAFDGCASVTEITLPPSVSSVAAGAFSGSNRSRGSLQGCIFR